MSTIKQPEVWTTQVKFEFSVDNSSAKRRRGGSMRFASATAALSESVLNSQSASLSAPPSPPPPPPRVDTKPASDVLAGAMARAASQGTIHPLDTLKVRMQSQGGTAAKRPLSKIAKLIPPAGADAAATAAKAQKAVSKAIPKVASLYRGVIGAASGAGIAIGTYFAFYGAASNMLSTSTTLAPGQIAFVAGGMAAAGGSVVKVPLAVCIRSVQAGVYPNVFKAAGAITEAAGVRGLFTGYLPTLLEDVPDMAFKFAAYETLRQVHRRLNDGRKANVQVSTILLFTVCLFALHALQHDLRCAAVSCLQCTCQLAAFLICLLVCCNCFQCEAENVFLLDHVKPVTCTQRIHVDEGNVLQEDFAMGACAGAFAAAATTPLDVIKTNMMCTAASRPTMMSASRAVLAQGGPKYFFRYYSGLCGNIYLASMNSVHCQVRSNEGSAVGSPLLGFGHSFVQSLLCSCPVDVFVRLNAIAVCCFVPPNSQFATNLMRLPCFDTLSISTCAALTVLPGCAGELERVRCPMASTVQCSSASLRLCVPRLLRRKSRYRSFSSYTLLSEHTCNQVYLSRTDVDHATGQDTHVALSAYISGHLACLYCMNAEAALCSWGNCLCVVLVNLARDHC